MLLTTAIAVIRVESSLAVKLTLVGFYSSYIMDTTTCNHEEKLLKIECKRQNIKDDC